MTLILAWSNPGIAFIACDRQNTYFHTGLGSNSVGQDSGIKLRTCTKGYYGVAGTLIAGVDAEGNPYDLHNSAVDLRDAEEILSSYTDSYESIYSHMGKEIELHQGEAKAELTMVVGDRVQVLEMNHGRVNLENLEYDHFTCSTPRDFSGEENTFRRVRALLLEWAVHRRGDMEEAFTSAWSEVLPHTQQVSNVFDVGITGQVNEQHTFQA